MQEGLVLTKLNRVNILYDCRNIKVQNTPMQEGPWATHETRFLQEMTQI